MGIAGWVAAGLVLVEAPRALAGADSAENGKENGYDGSQNKDIPRTVAVCGVDEL